MSKTLPYQVFYNFLTDDEIESLINHFNGIHEINKIHTNSWNNKDVVISEITKSSSSGRQVRITGIQSDMFPHITEKIKNLFDTILNGDSVIELPHFLTEYSVGSFHSPHTDYKVNEWYRDKVITIQLSESSDYDGGDLKIGEHILPRDKGCVLVYDGKDIHEVTMVTRGIRFSLTECAGLRPKKSIM